MISATASECLRRATLEFQCHFMGNKTEDIFGRADSYSGRADSGGGRADSVGGGRADIGGLLHRTEYNESNSNSNILFTPLDGSTAALLPGLPSTPLMVSQTQRKSQLDSGGG
jgi:hypothetical protein